MKEYLTIALAKGRILEASLDILKMGGLDCQEVYNDTRKLVITNEEQGVRYVLGKPTDIPTYVEYGAADLGIVGKDVLLEQGRDVYELLDLGIGYCRMAVARRKGDENEPINFVATKYPGITEQHFQKKGRQVEVIKLHGSIELAPLLNLSDAIVDLVSTGKTLVDNQLVEIEEIMPITSRLVANQSSYQMKSERIMAILNKINHSLNNKSGDE